MKKDYGIDIKWLAVTSFEMRFGSTTIVSDPYITECKATDIDWTAVENCDIITLTHSHWDHITDIPRLVEKFHSKILCGDMTAIPLAAWLNYTPSHIFPMYPDCELDFGDVKIKSLYGRHTNLKRGWNDLINHLHEHELCIQDPGIAALQVPGSMEYRNYLFTTPNGTKLLIWGGEPTAEQVALCKAAEPDIAIVQRPSTIAQAASKARFAAAIGCKVLIPHHQDFGKVENAEKMEKFGEEFLKLVPDGTYITPKHGEWIHI